jgi:DNA repair exonuclease SbcCD nuclease subunit
VLQYAHDTSPDLLVHVGDFFNRSKIPRGIVDLAYEPLFEVANKGIPVAIVPGNHERGRLPDSLWLRHSNIHIFDEPRSFTIESNGGDILIAGFPYYYGDLRTGFRSLLSNIRWHELKGKVKLLCMHHAVQGSQVGPSNYTFISGRDVVRSGDIPEDCTAVLAGHIHRTQILRSDDGGHSCPVISPGSTERTSFAEKDEPKGFYDITFKPDSSGLWQVARTDFIGLPARPMHDIELDTRHTERALSDYLLSKIIGIDEDAIVRINVGDDVRNEMQGILSAPYLRSVFPPTMNVRLGIPYSHRRNGKHVQR